MNTALYLVRSNKHVLIIEKEAYGGTLLETNHIDNYIGVGTTSGEDLADAMLNQVSQFQDYLSFKSGTVTGVKETLKGTYKVTVNGDVIETVTVVIATGVKHKELDVKGNAKHHVSNCVACDKLFYKDKDCIVVGGGDSAFEEGAELADTAKSVTLLYHHDNDDVKAEQVLQDRFNAKANTTAYYNHSIHTIQGNQQGIDHVGVSYSNSNVDTDKVIYADGVFSYIGVEPNTSAFKDLLELDYLGYIVTDDDMAAYNGGIYAVGDVRSGNIRQISTAVGDGAVASKAILEYLEWRKEVGYE